MQPQPLIVVDSVENSRRWYQDVLGLSGGHGGCDYERLFDDQVMVLQLHRWDAHEHAHLGDAAIKSRGNGVVLWFCCEKIDSVQQRAFENAATVLQPLQINTNANHREIWLRDPDGYVVVVAGLAGDLGAAVR